MRHILFTLLLLCCAASAWAQNPPYKVENIELKMLTGDSCKLPSWGEKHILIFYVDPDRHKQNEAFTYELEENRRASSPKIESFGVLNLKDTKLPKGIIRSMAKNAPPRIGHWFCRMRTARYRAVGTWAIATINLCLSSSQKMANCSLCEKEN